jgi:hypothetical protein
MKTTHSRKIILFSINFPSTNFGTQEVDTKKYIVTEMGVRRTGTERRTASEIGVLVTVLCESKRGNTGEDESITHTRWSGEWGT